MLIAPEPSVDVLAWAATGAMALTGRAGASPLGPPAGLVGKLRSVARVIEGSIGGGHPLVDPLGVLTARAAIAGLSRQSPVSCGGATRLLRAQDGWLAVSLARPDDLNLVPAWLEVPVPIDDVWSVVETTVSKRPVGRLVNQGALLGLPISSLPTTLRAAPLAPPPLHPLPVSALPMPGGVPLPLRPLGETLVVDLSSLWAGPLCGALLAAAGADVIKVESITRPDGARRGPSAFFDLLNHAKRSVALDLSDEAGRHALAALVARADVVIEASRPRALEQLGIDAERVVANGGPRIWASITGHGRSGPGRERVAFGDDAAVAGGLVSWDVDGPCFCGDAVADPTAGLVAAAAILDALSVGGRWLLDVSMAQVAAYLAGPTVSVSRDLDVASPMPPSPAGRAPGLGAHTDAVLAEVAPG